jgi:hypothetical protein
LDTEADVSKGPEEDDEDEEVDEEEEEEVPVSDEFKFKRKTEAANGVFKLEWTLKKFPCSAETLNPECEKPSGVNLFSKKINTYCKENINNYLLHFIFVVLSSYKFCSLVIL